MNVQIMPDVNGYASGYAVRQRLRVIRELMLSPNETPVNGEKQGSRVGPKAHLHSVFLCGRVCTRG